MCSKLIQRIWGSGNIVAGRDATLNNYYVNNYYGISEERFDELKDQLSITELALRNFFKMLEEKQVPRDDLDSKLREIAVTHKKMLKGLNEPRQVSDTRWVQSRQAVEAGNYAKALSLYEQSLRISLEIGDRMGEGAALNNIGQIYYMQRDYANALRYLEQSLAIHYMLGDKASEAATLNNIAQIHLCTGT